MQYLLKHTGGHIAFHGAAVDHQRNSHNYMADRNAEEQLYSQTGQLLKYLNTRPCKNESLSQALLNLYNELFFEQIYQALHQYNMILNLIYAVETYFLYSHLMMQN